MYRYIGVLLVEELDGTPFVVKAPPYKADVGQIVTFGDHTGKVVKCATMNPESEEYAILSAVIQIQEADALYAPRYVKEEENAD